MNEYRIVWVRIPTNYNDRHTLFVEAESKDDARALARNYFERTLGVAAREIMIEDVALAPEVPRGRILGADSA